MATVIVDDNIARILTADALNSGLKVGDVLNMAPAVAGFVQGQFGSNQAQIQSVTFEELENLEIGELIPVSVSNFGANGSGSIWWKINDKWKPVGNSVMAFSLPYMFTTIGTGTPSDWQDAFGQNGFTIPAGAMQNGAILQVTFYAGIDQDYGGKIKGVCDYTQTAIGENPETQQSLIFLEEFTFEDANHYLTQKSYRFRYEGSSICYAEENTYPGGEQPSVEIDEDLVLHIYCKVVGGEGKGVNVLYLDVKIEYP